METWNMKNVHKLFRREGQEIIVEPIRESF
jgi:hypothetical protein